MIKPAAWLLLSIVGLLPTGLCAAEEPGPDWMMQQTHGMVELHHIYTNTNYGFQIAIPTGSRAFMDAPPAPNHGVVIVLGDHRTIEISASFDAASYGSSEGVLSAYLKDERASGAMRTTALLGGRAAIRAKFVKAGAQEDVVAAWLDQSPDDAIDFTATLTTNQNSDEAIFSKVLASFRYVKRAN